MKAICLLTIVVALTGSGYELNHSRQQFSLYQHRGFDRIRATDFFLKGIPGHPELPVKFLHYIIPPNMRADSVRITGMEIAQIPGSYYIYPAQPDVPLCSFPRWVEPDSIIYNSRSPYPAKPVEVVNRGFFDGASIVTIAVYPLRYIPVDHKIFLVSEIEFDFFLIAASRPIRARVRGVNGQRTYDQALRAIVENDNEILLYYQPPVLIPDQPPELQRLEHPILCPYPYTIITSDDLAEAFQPFAEWLTDKGVPAGVIQMRHALWFPGVDDAERLRNYLKFGYEQWGTMWVLLGGDAGVVPFRYGWADTTTPPPGNNSRLVMPSDLYFSDMNGNWDCDPAGPDGRWGEPHDNVDVFPELFVGRLTVREPDNVQNWVNKMLHYEKNGSDDLSQFNRATWIYDSSNHPGEHDLYPHDTTRMAFPANFSHINRRSVIAPLARDAFGRVELDSVVAGIYNINCHGNPNYFFSYKPDKDTVWAYSFRQENANNAGLQYCDLTGCHYIVYDIGCYTAAFDPFLPHGDTEDPYYPSDTIMADAYTNLYPSTLGIAHLGNTRAGLLGGSPLLQYRFWRLIFQDTVSSLGVAEGLSKVEYPDNYLRHSHNLFGSPELEPWIMKPESMSVVVEPESIPQGETSTVLVRVTDQQSAPISGVRVCLTQKPRYIYKIGWTDSQGEVRFVLYPESPDTILITCTRPRKAVVPQFLPVQTTCAVIHGFGKGSQGEQTGLPKVLGFTALNPNPAFSDFTVQYGVPVKAWVKLLLYDVSGRVEAVIRDEELNPGYYQEVFGKQKRSLPAGVHFLVLTQDGSQDTRKVVVAQ